MNYIRDLVEDLVFFTVLLIIPSSFFGMVSELGFYVPGYFDLGMMSWLLGLFLLIWKFKGFRSFLTTPVVKLILVVVIYILFEFAFTLLKGVNFKEVFTVFRKLYFTPISLLGLGLYWAQLDLKRMTRIFLWTLSASAVQAGLFIMDNYMDLGIFAVSNYQQIFIDNVLVKRHTLAFPVFGGMVFLLSLIFAVNTRRYGWYLPFSVLFLAMLTLSVRSVLVQFLAYLVLAGILSLRRMNPVKFSKYVTGLAILGLVISIYVSYFMYSKQYFAGLVDEVVSAANIKDVGTYGFRLRLVQYSIQTGLEKQTLAFGNGYKRAAYSGEYDLVMGTDTHVAALIYTEGLVGLAIRMLPILLLLFWNMKEYLAGRDGYIRLLNIFTITLIVAEIPNFIQTSLLRDYSMGMFFLLAVETHKARYLKELRIAAFGKTAAYTRT